MPNICSVRDVISGCRDQLDPRAIILGCITNHRGIPVEASRAVYLSEEILRQNQGQMPGPRTLSITHQQTYNEGDILDRWHTSWPVQNIGHLFHGSSLASLSHKLRYGLRTIRGSTGGFSLDALASKLIKARAEAAAARSRCMTVLDCRLWSSRITSEARVANLSLKKPFFRLYTNIMGERGREAQRLRG